MTLDRHPRARRTALAAAIACSAIATVVPTSPAAAAPPPCGALGGLFVYELNDRCDFTTTPPMLPIDAMTIDVKPVVDRLSKAGLFATTVTCANGSVVPVVAQPNELLVSASNRALLIEALGQVRRRLGTAFQESQVINGLTARVFVRPGTIDDAFLARTIPKLQGVTFSTDLNYLESALPNNSFHPAGNPTTAEDPKETGAGGKGARVLVLDSPAQADLYTPAPDVVLSGPPAVYNLGDDETIDEDHGHGVFVASLIKRLAPEAEVTLYGVNGGQVPGAVVADAVQ